MNIPICEKCNQEMRFYSSMMTHACLSCSTHVKGVSWTEKEALDKYNLTSTKRE